jgi:hypothetical protein
VNGHAENDGNGGAMISFFWIFLAMVVYGTLHSIAASIWMKALAENWLGLFARRFYRLAYNVLATFGLLLLLGLVACLPDQWLYHVPSPWAWIMIILQVGAGIGGPGGALSNRDGGFVGLGTIVFARWAFKATPPFLEWFLSLDAPSGLHLWAVVYLAQSGHDIESPGAVSGIERIYFGGHLF